MKFLYFFLFTVLIDHPDAIVTGQNGKVQSQPDTTATGTTDLTVRHVVVIKNVKRGKIGRQLR